MEAIKLRPHQLETRAAVRSNYEKGVRRQVVAKATGTGKAIDIAYLPSYLSDLIQGQTLVLAHREELIDQVIEKLVHANPNLKVSKEMADFHADPNADIIVASVATLGRKNSSRGDKFDWDNIKIIITDECHHSSAQSYKNIYELAGVLNPNTTKLHIGFTATPRRSDGVGLSEIYDKIVYNYPLKKAVEDGWLVDPAGIRIKTNVSLDGVSTKAGDFNERELADTVNTPYRNALVVKAWQEHASQRHTIVFCVDIQHTKDLAEAFRKAGVKAEAVWGNDPERKFKLLRHKKGEIQVLLNCGIATEGYDDPRIDCVLITRPTKSHVLFTQMVGRGTRLYDGKKDCLVIDVVDNTNRHNLVVLPTLLGLPSGLNLNGKGVVWAAQELEKVQQKFPNADFNQLKDINKLDLFAEKIDLFADIKVLPEVEENSEFVWHVAPTGGYVLLLPEENIVTIKENLLDKWEIRATLNDKKYKGERSTMAEAFSAADELVRTHASEYLKIIKREAKWHDGPATDGQIKFIKKLYKGKAIPNDLSKGAASKLIGQALAGKGRFYGRRKG